MNKCFKVFILLNLELDQFNFKFTGGTAIFYPNTRNLPL